jgi:hypothetical protein
MTDLDFPFVGTVFALLLIPVILICAGIVRRIEAERKQREELRRHVREE